ncbi:BQ2448_2391 [Microbotryum intermedium]|uniref:BQ2448_2391 protein n=1 Tax=Microbotryum intermedium TaxID=269621 RepID=A0A238FBA9_9BASI|nr:BQ2448_2391 [Microbotryum intermedium]
MSKKLRLSSTLSKWVPRTRPLSLNRYAFKSNPNHESSLETQLDDGGGPSRLLDRKQNIREEQVILPVLQDEDKRGNSKKKKENTDKSILRIQIPNKPEPPGPEDCCQSGCAICVYDVYLSSIEEYHDALSSTLEKLRKKVKEQSLTLAEKDWPHELGSFDAFVKSGTSETVEGSKERAEEFTRVKSSLDPSLRAFLDMEARLKAKQNAKA